MIERVAAIAETTQQVGAAGGHVVYIIRIEMQNVSLEGLAFQGDALMQVQVIEDKKRAGTDVVDDIPDKEIGFIGKGEIDFIHIMEMKFIHLPIQVIVELDRKIVIGRVHLPDIAHKNLFPSRLIFSVTQEMQIKQQIMPGIYVYLVL